MISRGGVNDSNLHASNIVKWALSYGAGDNPKSFTVLQSGAYNFPPDSLLKEWDCSELPDGNYVIKLEGADVAGNKCADSVTVLKSTVSTNTEPELEIINNEIVTPGQVDENENPILMDSSITITYQDIAEPSTTLTDGELYIDGVLIDNDDSDGLTVDFLEQSYEEESLHYLYVKAEDDHNETIYCYDIYCYFI